MPTAAVARVNQQSEESSATRHLFPIQVALRVRSRGVSPEQFKLKSRVVNSLLCVTCALTQKRNNKPSSHRRSCAKGMRRFCGERAVACCSACQPRSCSCRMKAIPARKPAAQIDGARSISRVRASAVARARVACCSAASLALGMRETLRDRPAVLHAACRDSPDDVQADKVACFEPSEGESIKCGVVQLSRDNLTGRPCT